MSSCFRRVLGRFVTGWGMVMSTAHTPGSEWHPTSRSSLALVAETRSVITARLQNTPGRVHRARGVVDGERALLVNRPPPRTCRRGRSRPARAHVAGERAAYSTSLYAVTTRARCRRCSRTMYRADRSIQSVDPPHRPVRPGTSSPRSWCRWPPSILEVRAVEVNTSVSDRRGRRSCRSRRGRWSGPRPPWWCR